MTVSLLALVAACAGSTPEPATGPDTLAQLYDRGRTWPAFFAGVNARKALWTENYERGEPAAELVARALAVPGVWRVLAVAEDSCSDSASTIPYLARLVELVPSIELRIVGSRDGRWVMESHRTEDGRAATPTIVLLDERFEERGCFVERPAALRRFLAEHRPRLAEDEVLARKMVWYREDRGGATVRDFVEMLEAAAAGTPRCPKP
jgi:hypothetical protein